jgi:hypothetical protein
VICTYCIAIDTINYMVEINYSLQYDSLKMIYLQVFWCYSNIWGLAALYIFMVLPATMSANDSIADPG